MPEPREAQKVFDPASGDPVAVLKNSKVSDVWPGVISALTGRPAALTRRWIPVQPRPVSTCPASGRNRPSQALALFLQLLQVLELSSAHAAIQLSPSTIGPLRHADLTHGSKIVMPCPCRTSTCRSFNTVVTGSSPDPASTDPPICGTNPFRPAAHFQGATPDGNPVASLSLTWRVKTPVSPFAAC